jgi:hypothetical protein
MVVQFRVLGEVEARADGQLVELGHARQRCVLVTLLVQANHPQQALALFREIGDQAGEARADQPRPHLWQQGHYPQAAEHHQQALALCRAIGDRAGEAHALTNLGGWCFS